METLRKVVPYSTVIAAVIYEVVSIFQGTNSLYENFILTLLILITTTFILNDMHMSDKVEKCLGRVGGIIDSSSIQTFPSVDLCAKEIKNLVSSGSHKVDFVSIDTVIRTGNKKKSNAMHDTVKHLFSEKSIHLLYLTYLRAETVDKFIRNINVGNLRDNNNTYGYIDCEGMIPFATFLIIDDKIVITRSPYEDGTQSDYILIRNSTMVNYYKDWTRMIWRSAKHIESMPDIEEMYNIHKSDLTDQQKADIDTHLKEIKNKIGG